MAEYIDMTPTWTEVLPDLIFLMERGTPAGLEFAKAELLRMSKAATEWQNTTETTVLNPSPAIMLHTARSVR